MGRRSACAGPLHRVWLAQGDRQPKAAREARDDARKLLRSGTDPAQQRQLDKLSRQTVSATTFEAVARELHATKHSGWSPRYASRWIERMEKDLFPWIGSLPLKDITAPLLLQTLRRIEGRGAHETAHTLRQTAGQVFRYGIATGRCERDPAPDLHGALQPIVVKHMAAVLEPAGVSALMRAIANYEGQPLTAIRYSNQGRPGSRAARPPASARQSTG